MRPRRSLVSAVLAAALLLGQWLVAAHETDHSLQPGAAHACAVCVYAHGAGNGALPAALELQLGVPSPLSARIVAIAPGAVLVRLHPIRGPPTLLA